MQFKKILAPFLAGICALSLCSCGSDTDPTLPDPHEFYAVQDKVAERFNSAVDKLAESDSYTMKGSIASTAEVVSSAELTSGVTPIDCAYQNGSFVIDASDSKIDPRITYFDGEHYYYTLYMFEDKPVHCFTDSNDHTDFAAADYLLKVDAEILLNPQYAENEDGSATLSFSIPFTVYESPAMIGHLGFIVDETHQANPLSVYATLDHNGYFTSFIISFVNDTAFGDEPIHQEIVANMALSDYNCTVLTPPENLDDYEDWSEEMPDVPTEGVGDHSPEDVQ